MIVDVYFPHQAVVSLVAVLSDGSTAEVAMFGREGVVGVISAIVSRETFGRYVVQVPGTASRLSFDQAQKVFDQSPSGRLVLRRYIEALMAQSLQTVACNALHTVEARCCRWLLTTQDRIESGYAAADARVPRRDAGRSTSYREPRDPATAVRRPHQAGNAGL